MRDAIRTLAKAAVTALVKPDDLVVETGHKAIDLLFGWLPQKGKLDALIARVEGELERLAEAEFQGRADLEPAIGNATILFERFGLTATELVDLSLKPERATEELLKRGEGVLRAAGEAVAGLCGGRIVPRVYELLLSDPQTIAELSPAITQALLSQREAIDKLPDEVALALRRMLGRHLVIDPTEIWRPELSDIYLLRAEYGVVPFHEQRRPEVDRLLAWCEADARMAVRVVTGAGGTGKTRLMIELCKEARRRRWRAGFLHREVPPTPSWELDGLVDGEAPLLLVVDYAETKRDVLVPVLRRLSLDHASPKTPGDPGGARGVRLAAGPAARGSEAAGAARRDTCRSGGACRHRHADRRTCPDPPGGGCRVCRSPGSPDGHSPWADTLAGPERATFRQRAFPAYCRAGGRGGRCGQGRRSAPALRPGPRGAALAEQPRERNPEPGSRCKQRGAG